MTWELFFHSVLHATLDSLKMLPFLFLAYLLIEWVEHGSSHKLQNFLKRFGKFGPVGGAALGLIPQCGFSATAANLFSCRLITAGTLVSVFLATSDEAILVLLANPSHIGAVLPLLGVKLVVAILGGLLVDLFWRRSLGTSEEEIHHLCQSDHCGCGHGILRPALKHTAKTFLFILLVSILLHAGIEWLGEDRLASLLLSETIFQPIIAALIGFIPNCAASVLLTPGFAPVQALG